MTAFRRATFGASPRPTRPRVILADDHVAMLDFVSKSIADDFDVVAMVNDGRHAVEATSRLDPDLIVLDVSMPDLDGFETLKELTRIGSRAKVVFLTLHDADEYVAEALRSGANGYVVKTLMRSQLVDALDHALAGRTFLPAVSPLALAEGSRHAAYFYAYEREVVDAAVRYLSTALLRGDTTAVTLTESTRRSVADELDAHGWDLATLRKQGRYLEYDADEAASRISDDGRGEDYVDATFDAIERQRVASSAGADTRLTLFGHIAARLCEKGEVDAAIGLERQWNALTRQLPYLTVCAYPIDGFVGDARRGLPAHICAQHSCVSHATA